MTSKTRQQKGLQYAAAGYGGGLTWKTKAGAPDPTAENRARHNKEVERRKREKADRKLGIK